MKYSGGNGHFFSSCCAASMVVIILVITACASDPQVRELPIETEVAGEPQGQEKKPLGIADEIRGLVELGTPPALIRALDLIRSRDLGQTEFGRIMNTVASTLLQRLYPDISINAPLADPPQTHTYTRILMDADRGNYTPASASSSDYLELVLPFLAFLNENRRERLGSALPDLQRASEINTTSVLAPYFIGLVSERLGRLQEAEAAYTAAYALSRDCYPAALGLARTSSAEGRMNEAIRILQELLPLYPENMSIKRELAMAYYTNRDWSRAEPAIAEILQRDPKNGTFLLMRAHILVELGQYLQAQPLLDAYANIDPGNRLYLFLRARVQAEGYRNQDAALTYLRSILLNSPGDKEAAAFAARLLMESGRPEDEREGRQLLRNLLATEQPEAPVLDLAVRDAVSRASWIEALRYIEQLLLERRSSSDLLYAYQIQLGLGNTDAALSFARELYERDPQSEEGASAYISALISAGRQEEAARMIDARLSTLSGGTVKSKYYYLRSRLKTDEEGILNDLRSSLFEDPRNLQALIAMMEIYHIRRDERRTVYYLKQALALAPDNPTLKRYQVEYAAALGTVQ